MYFASRNSLRIRITRYIEPQFYFCGVYYVDVGNGRAYIYLEQTKMSDARGKVEYMYTTITLPWTLTFNYYITTLLRTRSKFKVALCVISSLKKKEKYYFYNSRVPR